MHPEAKRVEAQTWLRRLTSGAATRDDLEALDRWRAQSPANAEAFAEAALLWNALGDATEGADLVRAARADAAQLRQRAMLRRRAFLVGGGAVAACVTAGAVVQPPFGLWPSISELGAAYRTGTGERRQIQLATSLSVELNTQTSVELRSQIDEAARIELIQGELAITMRGGTEDAITILAGPVRTYARSSVLNVRRDRGEVSVTCVAGAAQVQTPEDDAQLRPGQQIVYGAGGMHSPRMIEPELVTGWQQGLLIFRDAPLSRVVEEVNRYRRGRIVLLDEPLARRRVVATFRLDRIDGVIEFMAEIMKIPTRSLPGGLVLLG